MSTRARCCASVASASPTAFTSTLARKRPDRKYERALDDHQEAHLIALACATPTDGQTRWSRRLLADEMVRLAVVDTLSAELELSVLTRQCLAQRLPTPEAMVQAVTAWADRRNAAIPTINWQFTTPDARIKIRRLYPAYDV